MILLATAFFIRSIDTAHATPTPQNFLQQGTNKIGKYAMAFVMNSQNWKAVIIMDTETGKSKIFNEGSEGFKPNAAQLPENPMQ